MQPRFLTYERLLETEYTFDVLLSDFGREAAIDYARFAAHRERRLIQSALSAQNLPFFDEYRRIMFSMVGDIRFFKRKQIDAQLRTGPLRSDILIGIGDTKAPSDVVVRIATAVAEQALIAEARGYSNVRLVIPCNTLRDLGDQIASFFRSPARLVEGMRREGLSSLPGELIAKLDRIALQVRLVPDVVIGVIGDERRDLLILGTTMAVDAYRSVVKQTGHQLTILDLSPEEQEVVDQTIVAAIDGDIGVVTVMRERLEERVIAPRKSSTALLVVEACTDLQLGIGLSSLQVFADSLVDEAYFGALVDAQ